MVDTAKTQLNAEDLEFVTSSSEARLLSTPNKLSWLIKTVTLFLVALFVWASISQIDEIVKAQGKVIPSSHIQTIQSLEGGILKELSVQEGQSVKKGELLVEIDSTDAMSFLGEQNANRYSLQATVDRLNALAKNNSMVTFSTDLAHFPEIKAHEMALFNNYRKEVESKVQKLEYEIQTARSDLSEIKSSYLSARDRIEIAKKQYAMNKEAADSGVISQSDALSSQSQLIDARNKLNSAKQQIESQLAKVHSLEKELEGFIESEQSKVLKERSEVEARLKGVKAKSLSAQDKLDRTLITSPINGIIKKIEINTIGGVIKSGQTILEVVPTEEDLLVEVKVKPKDIGFIREGLKAMVKITAYDFSTFGGLNGTVEYVSPDSTIDRKERSFYTVRIRTEGNTLTDKKGNAYSIIPGMQSEVNIIVGDKSVLEYLFKPLLK